MSKKLNNSRYSASPSHASVPRSNINVLVSPQNFSGQGNPLKCCDKKKVSPVKAGLPNHSPIFSPSTMFSYDSESNFQRKSLENEKNALETKLKNQQEAYESKLLRMQEYIDFLKQKLEISTKEIVLNEEKFKEKSEFLEELKTLKHSAEFKTKENNNLIEELCEKQSEIVNLTEKLEKYKRKIKANKKKNELIDSKIFEMEKKLKENYEKKINELETNYVNKQSENKLKTQEIFTLNEKIEELEQSHQKLSDTQTKIILNIKSKLVNEIKLMGTNFKEKFGFFHDALEKSNQKIKNLKNRLEFWQEVSKESLKNKLKMSEDHLNSIHIQEIKAKTSEIRELSEIINNLTREKYILLENFEIFKKQHHELVQKHENELKISEKNKKELEKVSEDLLLETNKHQLSNSENIRLNETIKKLKIENREKEEKISDIVQKMKEFKVQIKIHVDHATEISETNLSHELTYFFLKLTRSLHEKNEIITSLNEKNESLMKNCEKLTVNLQNLSEIEQKLKRQISELNTNFVEQSKISEHRKNQIYEKDSFISTLNTEIHKLKSLLSSETHEKEAKMSEISGLESEKNNLINSLKEKNLNIEIFQERIKNHSQIIEELQIQIEKLNETISMNLKSLKENKLVISEKNQMIINLQEKVSEIQTEKNKAEIVFSSAKNDANEKMIQYENEINKLKIEKNGVIKNFEEFKNLKKLESIGHKEEINSYQQKIESLELEIQDLKQKIESIKIDQINGKLKELETDSSTIKINLSLSNEINKYKEIENKLRKEIFALESTNKHLLQKVSNLEDSNSKSSELNEFFKDRIKKMESENKANQNSIIEQQNEKIEELNKIIQRYLKEIQYQKENFKEKIREKDLEIINQQNILHEFQLKSNENVSEVQEKLLEKDKKIDVLDAESKNLRKEINDLKSENKNLQHIIFNLKSSIDNLKRIMEESGAFDINELREKCTQLETKLILFQFQNEKKLMEQEKLHSSDLKT